MTPEEKRTLQEEIFTTRPDKPCEDCGGYHLRACLRVKRQVWIGQGAAAGNRVEVEYWPQWDDSETIYPEDVWGDEIQEETHE